MALPLIDCYPMTIVDWTHEWVGRVEGQSDGQQRGKDYIYRGVIVKVEGDAQEQSVTGLWVCFGETEETAKHFEGHPEKTFKVNGKEVLCRKMEGSELSRVYDYESKHAKRTWARLFGIPTNVGSVRKQSAPHRKVQTIADNLALTSTPKVSVVEDGTGDAMDLPAPEA